MWSRRGALGALAGGLALAAAPRVARADSAAQDPDRKLEFHGTAMGTVVSVFFWTDDDVAAAKAAEAVFEEMKRIDLMMTTWTADSEVAKVNAASGKQPMKVGAETFAVIARAMDVAKRTGGVFDITVGAFQGLWKFDQDMDGTLPDQREVKKRLALIGYRNVVLDAKKQTVFLKKAGMAITLGGIAKGYAVDKCVAILQAKGYVDFMVQAGGDMYISGKKGPESWKVAIRDPRGPQGSFFAAAPVENHSFSTSGDYERGFVKDGVRYHHILDPKSGEPAHASRSVTVRAIDAFTADAWSKVMFILGPVAGQAMIAKQKLTDFEVVWVDAKNEIKSTPGLVDLVILKQPTAGI